jgi:indoleamine 2,3-dioxygenase
LTALTSIKHYERAFVVLSMITQAYVWGGRKEHPKLILPNSLAIPLTEIAEKLGFPPISNYASTVLFNWHLLNPNEPILLK